MEERAQRRLVLLLVVVLHLPLLWGLIHLGPTPRTSPRDVSRPLRVEWVLTPSPPDQALLRVRRTATAARAIESSAAPDTLPAAAARPSIDRPDATAAAIPGAVPAFRLVDTDGRLRVSSRLAEELDAERAAQQAQAERDASTFHAPLGDVWVMREPSTPIDKGLTVFSEDWMPTDMDPVTEACWRNAAVRFLLVTMGSVTCANPGGKPPAPTPEMIVYGQDSGREILRKTDEWREYER